MSDYDELVQRLREQYMDTKQMLPNVLCHDSADAITALQSRVAELSERNEQLQVQLAGCGVAALQNTRQSIAEQRIGRDQYGFSGSYEEVCNAVDREINWRERAERAEADLAAARALLETARRALADITLAGMSLPIECGDDEQAKMRFHARQAWTFISVAANAKADIDAALREGEAK